MRGNIWDVDIPSLGGSTWVGPHGELQAHITRQGYSGRLQAAHIVGGEHLFDIRSPLRYGQAPCVAVATSLHAQWTADISTLQGQRGGRGVRPRVTDLDVIGLLHDVYMGHPELQWMARDIVMRHTGRVGGQVMPPVQPPFVMPPYQPAMPPRQPVMPPYQPAMPPRQPATPSATFPMDVYQRPVLGGGTSPMDAYQRPVLGGGTSPMDAYQRPTLGSRSSPMDVYQRPSFGAGTSPMDAYQRPTLGGGSSPMDVHQRPSLGGSPVAAEGGALAAEVGAGGGLTAGRVAVGAVRSLVVSNPVTAVVLGGLHLVHAWITYEPNVMSDEERRLRQLFGTKVEPGVAKALAAQAPRAEQMTNEAPEFPVYANVTVDLVETWWESGIAGNPTERAVRDARFVGLNVGRKNISASEVIDTDSETTGGYNNSETKRVTYSVKVDFGETPAEHRWRMFFHQAAQAARRRLSARAVAGHTHFGGDLSPAEEREEQRRQRWGDPSLREQRDREERILWVRAYVEYTAFYGPDDLYMDAVKYLKELEEAERASASSTASPFPSLKPYSVWPQGNRSRPYLPPEFRR